MRVIIAGQSVPESFGWNHCCEIKELDGIHEAEEWLPVIKSMGRVVPSSSPIEFLRAACLMSKGRPSDMAQFIKTFPRAQ